MNIIFRPYNSDDFETLKFLVKNFYNEDSGYCRIDDKNIENTIDEFRNHPEKGCTIVFELGKEIIGYSILINYWSNEYGGNMVVIDELYIVPAHRRKGYATFFLRYLCDKEMKKSKGIQLEVGKKNRNAYKLYKKNGFKLINNRLLFFDFKD